MPLVYVHGIGNRWDDRSFQLGSDRRNGLFRQFLLTALGAEDPRSTAIPTPLWGDDGGNLRWDGASMQGRIPEELGLGRDDTDLLAELALGAESLDPDRLLCALAKDSVADAVDLLYSVADDRGDTAFPETAASLVAYTSAAAARAPHGDESSRHPWLADVKDDYELVDALWEAAQAWSLDAAGAPVPAPRPGSGGTLGLGDSGRDLLRRGQRHLRRAVVGLPTSGLVALSRAVLGRRTAMLVGDVAKYLAQRDGSLHRDNGVLGLVVTAIEQARAGAPADAPLVIVAHSMGANIVYDLLTAYRTDLVVDVLVTVGTQVGLFEELELFRSSDSGIPDRARRRVPQWPNIRHWINVVDPGDPLAYRASPIFEGVEDYRYPSNAPWAHSRYLLQPHFHARIADRVRQALA
jgi:hypothetical protein